MILINVSLNHWHLRKQRPLYVGLLPDEVFFVILQCGNPSGWFVVKDLDFQPEGHRFKSLHSCNDFFLIRVWILSFEAALTAAAAAGGESAFHVVFADGSSHTTIVFQFKQAPIAGDDG